MIRLLYFYLLLLVLPTQGQTDFSKGTYTTLDGVATDAYIASRNWNEPFESIQVKTNLNDSPKTIAIEQLQKLFVSPENQFVRQKIWKAPVWVPDHTELNYTKNEAVFLKLVGYGKVSLYTYYEGTTQRIVYQAKSNRFMEFVPPNATATKTGKPLDYKDQIKADFNSSLYQERDLKQLTYSLLTLIEFVRNYNSYIRDDNQVAYSEVVAMERAPHGEVMEEPDFEVPFAVVEKSPVYPGCENLATEEEIKTCLNTALEALFVKHFKYPKAAAPEHKDKKMFVKFLIQKDGTVQLSSLRAAHPSIDEELRRVFGKMKKLKPGMVRNTAVNVAYFQVFKVKEKK
ncbi:hypothetical protein [Flavobacterium orientale]|uniref:TonB protein C-terminal n=1 Tax=Flavobacterium orientale TaxID=1756020 RepID=A0A916Y1L9_9FLAO|nr:hypothetical protein [Flavobacterium orientale]GGD26533.1 hypothetical protein GCM10011343_15950 [Flavobacterium orientale]